MKLPRFTMVVLTIIPATAANCSRPHGRTLSATAKKPASVARSLYLRLSITRLTTPLSFRSPTFPEPSFPQVDYSNSK